MEDIVLIIVGVIVLLLLMFLVFKFLMREQSYDNILKQKQQVLENAVPEQKPGKQKRRQVYSKHNDKSKLVDDKQKLTDDKPVTDDKQKSADGKEKSSGHKQKFQEEKFTKSDVVSSVAKSGVSCVATSSPSKKHVEIESKVETIDLELLSQRPATPELGLSSHPSRSILVNKDEKSLVIQAESVPETFHPRPGPVDELDKKHQEEGRSLSETILIADAEPLKEKTEARAPSPPTGKSNQKRKKKGNAVEVACEQEGMAISFNASHAVQQESPTKTQDVARRDLKDAVSVTVKMLENGDLDEQSCKTLVKALESKGFNVVSSSKKKKDDDCSAEALKKPIRDLEASLQKEKLAVASSEAQVKQLRDQLALQQQKSETLKKSQQSQTAKQIQEINDLKSRLEMTLKVHDQERLQLQTRLDSVQLEVDERSRVVEALMEENGRLKATAGTSSRNGAKQKTNLLQARCDASLEDNIKQFEDQFEEMVAKQEMEKMKEDNEALVHSLRSQITELKAEILERDNKLELLQSHGGSTVSVNDSVVCEKISVRGQQNVSAPPPSYADVQDEIIANGTEQNSIDQTAFLDKKVKDMEELLQKQRQKNDDLRQKNWKVMEALTEMENELKKSHHSTGKSGTSDMAECLVMQLTSVQSEKGDLKRLSEDQERLIISLQHQIANLQNQIDHRESRKIIERGFEHGTALSDHETEIMKLEESLNRQILKNDDLRRRNWKTMEALSEMEKRLHNKELGSESGSGEVSHLKEQLRSLQKDKVDLEILNKGLGSNLTTCVRQVEQAEKCSSDALNQLKKVTSEYNTLKASKTSTDGLNDSQLKRIAQLETFISEKNNRIKQLEEELLTSQRTVANDFSGPVSLTSADSVTHTRADGQSSVASGSANRKEVMVVTRIQETSKWDMSQLILELDTKTAEVEILQSLLDQHDTSLHNLQEEKSKTLESVHHMRQALKEKDVAIQSLQAQLKNSSTTEANGSEYEKIRTEQKSLEEQVKHYQDVLADTAGMLSKLQLSVEKEESKWLQKVAEAEEKTDEALQEAKQLRDELETLRKSS